jgi:hypothetical protein
VIYSIQKEHRALAGMPQLLEASREDLRVLVCLLEAGSADEGDLATASGCTPEDVTAALGFWRGAGIVTRGGDTAQARVAKEEVGRVTRTSRLTYRADEIGEKVREYGLSSLIAAAEQLWSREFGRVEMEVFVYLTEQCGLSAEYLLLLAGYCKEKGKISVKYMEKFAYSLLEKGVDTPEKLEKHMVEEQERSTVIWRLRALLGMADREPTKTEAKYLSEWTETLGYGESMVGLAYDVTVHNTGKVALAYMNKLLTAWHEGGCKTEADARAQMERERAAKGWASKKEKEKPTVSQFDPDDALAAALKRSYGN